MDQVEADTTEILVFVRKQRRKRNRHVSVHEILQKKVFVFDDVFIVCLSLFYCIK